MCRYCHFDYQCCITFYSLVYTTSFPCEAKFIAKNLTSISRDGKNWDIMAKHFCFFNVHSLCILYCIHKVFSVFLFVCLFSPFSRIKHVTYVNVNILCCMGIYVWRFVVMTSRCLCILMCKWLRVFVLEFACLSSLTVLFVSQLHSCRYHKHDCSV